ncbi:MAG TPA: thiamine diphosphokinase [Anaerolineaceae bacterium]|nr:thiamine diphosphokinase [Anaerolineaceae bacterium]
MSTTERAVLFANGEAPNLTALELQAQDFLVAVDGGLHHLQDLGLSPQLLIGDMDSLTTQEVEACKQAGAEVLRFPPAKNKTDLELALDEVLHRGYREIVIAFALGDRLDQTLGNLALLSRPDLGDCSVRIDDGLTEVALLRQTITHACQPGDTVSLLAWGGEAGGVVTHGLEYALEGETLLPWQTRGISNRCTGERFSVSLEQGALLLIHTRQNQDNRGTV